MHVLHVVPLIHASTGGPAVSVTRLASEQAGMGHEVTLACLDYPQLGIKAETNGVRRLEVKGNILAVRGRGWSPKFRRVVMEAARRADVVHNHGLWMWPNAYAREGAVRYGKPLVISPRGMLEAWSLRRSRLRKTVAWRLFERQNLQSAAMFHATAVSEAENIRRALRELSVKSKDGKKVPIVVSPNGVDLANLEEKPSRELLEKEFPRLRGRRWVVFMSRLHPKKGLDVLLKAWKQLFNGSNFDVLKGKDEEKSPILIIAGANLVGYRREVERMVRELGLEDSVVLMDEVRGGLKDCLLGNAEIFVLPSYSENFGIVVAEAMAWGCPVITTTGTPWAEIAEIGAGWWVAPEEEALGRALEEALGKSQDELKEMGKKGRGLVREKYDWKEASAKVVAGYEEILKY